MNIVHICTSDIVGGASIAAYRLHKELINSGYNSKMLVINKQTDDSDVIKFHEGVVENKFLSRVRSFGERTVNYTMDKTDQFSVAMFGTDISKEKIVEQADIIHLHWINAGFLSMKTLEKLFKVKKKFIWTMHDMWPLTGGCHYSLDCNGYKNQCKECYINNNNLAHRLLLRKKEIYKELDIDLIACSQWTKDIISESVVLGNKRITVIPNIVDHSIFKPSNKKIAKKNLNLAENKKVITFGAISATDDKRKGYVYLKESIEILINKNPEIKNELIIMVFGSSREIKEDEFGIEIKNIGFIKNQEKLANVYSASDVFVGPSLAETFGQTYLESILCGTPAVAFNYSGPKDIIKHKQNGYLAEYKNATDLANGIYWCITREGEQTEITKLAQETFDKKDTVQKYIEFYESLI